MLRRIIFVAVFNATCALSLVASFGQRDSLYTDLSSARCQNIKVDQETGSSVQRCGGVGGYSLLVEDDDARQSVTVVTPDGKQHPLQYWHVVTTAFSTLGEKAEWRVIKQGKTVVPIALIVRVNANENPDAPNERTSYLAVAKITPKKICVTEKIKGGATANSEARRAADSSAEKPCLE